MRVNIYEEEVTKEFKLVTTTADTGKVFYGVRFFLHSANELHHSENDDDRSAVTFWLHDPKKAELFFTDVVYAIRKQGNLKSY